MSGDGEEITRRYAMRAPRYARGMKMREQVPHPVWAHKPSAEQIAKRKASMAEIYAEMDQRAAALAAEKKAAAEKALSKKDPRK